nr:WG repeat-containing protein [Neisseria elongata]
MNKKTAALFSAAFLAAATLPAAAIAMPSICVKPDPDVAARFDGVGCYDNVVMLIQKNGLYGYAELDGKIIIPPQYQDAADKPAERFPRNRELLIPVKKGKALGLHRFVGQNPHPVPLSRGRAIYRSIRHVRQSAAKRP